MRRTARRIHAHVAGLHRRNRPHRFWISVAIMAAAAGLLVAHYVFKGEMGAAHHLAVAVLAERLAGLHTEGGE